MRLKFGTLHGRAKSPENKPDAWKTKLSIVSWKLHRCTAIALFHRFPLCHDFFSPLFLWWCPNPCRAACVFVHWLCCAVRCNHGCRCEFVWHVVDTEIRYVFCALILFGTNNVYLLRIYLAVAERVRRGGQGLHTDAAALSLAFGVCRFAVGWSIVLPTNAQYLAKTLGQSIEVFTSIRNSIKISCSETRFRDFDCWNFLVCGERKTCWYKWNFQTGLCLRPHFM